MDDDRSELERLCTRDGITAEVQELISSEGPSWARQKWLVILRRDLTGAAFELPFYGGGAAQTPTAADVLDALLADLALYEEEDRETLDELFVRPSAYIEFVAQMNEYAPKLRDFLGELLHEYRRAGGGDAS